jgi:hypothetical protein
MQRFNVKSFDFVFFRLSNKKLINIYQASTFDHQFVLKFIREAQMFVHQNMTSFWIGKTKLVRELEIEKYVTKLLLDILLS